jgi:hypothetical protein
MLGRVGYGVNLIANRQLAQPIVASQPAMHFSEPSSAESPRSVFSFPNSQNLLCLSHIILIISIELGQNIKVNKLKLS